MENTCPPGLVERTDPVYLQVRDGSCFYFVCPFQGRKDYGNANDNCKEDGGTLAMPKTKSVNDFLYDQIFSTYTGMSDEVWIGLEDKNNEYEYTWVDGSDLEWDNFAKRNGYDKINAFVTLVEPCVTIDRRDRGLWHDYRCDDDFVSWITMNDSKKSYICQYTPADEDQEGITGK